MDHSKGRNQRMRYEGDHPAAHPSQSPRPYNTASSRTPIQLSAPPRSHQYHTPTPGNLYVIQNAPRPHDCSVGTAQPSFVSKFQSQSTQRSPYINRQPSNHQPPPRAYQPLTRNMSHMSAFSVSQPDTDSRPVSDSFIVSPALPSEAVSEIGEEEEYEHNYRSKMSSRAGSRGRRTKTTTPTRSRKHGVPVRDSETLPSTDQAATVEALTAAIRQGHGTTTAASRSLTPKPLADAQGFRMPFQGEPSSPSSIYTDTTATNTRMSMPLSSYQGYDPRDTPATIVEQEVDEYDRSQYGQDLPTPTSTHPIISTPSPGMSSKIPPERRPLKLDIDAVREAQARGSMTSLSDLIKRATRLASNLDRGRTASRLGYLDMFGSSDKLGQRNGSTYSDVLDAFPPPAHGANSPGNGRPNTLWPIGDKQFMTSKSSLGRFVETNEKEEKLKSKSKRKCCGLPPVVFTLLLISVVLLVAAAVLVPLFLLVLNKPHQSVNLATCLSSHLCQNGGHSVSLNDVCSCVCVDGFTGDECSTQKDPECVTASVADGGNTYDNATIGSSVLPLLQNAQTTFEIPLNTTKILSRFAYNNLSCAGENSLVDFGVTRASTAVKRFVIVPGMMSTDAHIPALNLPLSESKQHPRFVIVEGLDDMLEEIDLLPTHVLAPRQDATQSANGIVFATSSVTASTKPTATAAASGTGSNSTPTTSSPPSTQTTKLNATDTQLDFAAIVVLFVLQSSADISDAVAANQDILAHLSAINISNGTVKMLSNKEVLTADFDKFQIKFPNGTVVGGEGSVAAGS